jgi:hypothetical protein
MQYCKNTVLVSDERLVCTDVQGNDVVQLAETVDLRCFNPFAIFI